MFDDDAMAGHDRSIQVPRPHLWGLTPCSTGATDMAFLGNLDVPGVRPHRHRQRWRPVDTLHHRASGVLPERGQHG
ncbi:hypothetical protein CR157_19010 [Halomonas sp. LBP4]|nr:hypothetical protein CR157_19010 [Halomonas sp. LBP4]